MGHSTGLRDPAKKIGLQRRLISAKTHRAFRASAMQTWRGSPLRLSAIECAPRRGYHSPT